MPDRRLQALMEDQNAKHYCAIGKVAVKWSRFKGYLDEMLKMLAGVDAKFGECLTAHIHSVDEMLNALTALADLRSPGVANESSFTDHLDRIRSLAQRRDQVIDDIWTFDPGVTNRWPTRMGSTYEPGPISMPTLEVEALAWEIEQMSDTFLDFRRGFLLPLGLWPGQ
jgi:hypothetical protein